MWSTSLLAKEPVSNWSFKGTDPEISPIHLFLSWIKFLMQCNAHFICSLKLVLMAMLIMHQSLFGLIQLSPRWNARSWVLNHPISFQVFQSWVVQLVWSDFGMDLVHRVKWCCRNPVPQFQNPSLESPHTNLSLQVSGKKASNLHCWPSFLSSAINCTINSPSCWALWASNRSVNYISFS